MMRLSFVRMDDDMMMPDADNADAEEEMDGEEGDGEEEEETI